MKLYGPSSICDCTVVQQNVDVTALFFADRYGRCVLDGRRPSTAARGPQLHNQAGRHAHR